MYEYRNAGAMERIPDRQQAGKRSQRRVNGIVSYANQSKEQSVIQKGTSEQELHDTMYMLEYY
ncbi:MAG: hypothetical protein K9G67_10705 [Bacteroidales bacterium]|nr:hypothetical protein [Bacteroidales bacterium]MCF8351088.1 hypothetical protein [Bacteroidales bacterium]MCF8376814.1 hypothetical protein [Bacteroidales bacterium]MCF8400721.1 hypothetical protein [Bacteroidales bacterium]